MPINQWPHSERPREKLLSLGPQALSDAELLAIFLRTGCKGKSAVDLSRELLIQFRGLRALLDADQKSFCQIRGLGKAKYTQLQAVLEMARRHLSSKLEQGTAFNSTRDVKDYLVACLRHKTREVFAVLFLNNQHQLIRYEELFQGTINCAHIYPREVVKRALEHNAAAVILAHNHPSGLAEPSQADHDVTIDIKRALAIIDVNILDHLIIGNGEVTSFAERGFHI